MLYIPRTFDDLPLALETIKHRVYKRKGETTLVRVDMSHSKFKNETFDRTDYRIKRKIENLFVFSNPKERTKVIFEEYA